jgi:hypothetical protein
MTAKFTPASANGVWRKYDANGENENPKFLLLEEFLKPF